MAARKTASAKKKTAKKKKKTATKAAVKKTTRKATPAKRSAKTTAKKAATQKKPAAKKPAARKAATKKSAPPAAKKKAATGKKATSKKASAKSAAPGPAPPEPAPRPSPGRAVIAFRDSDERNRLGEKWTCFGCGTRFYDLGKEPAVCPKCGADQSQRPKESPASSTPAPAPRRVARPMAPLLEEDDDAVRYDEEFDLGIQDSDDEESTARPDLFPDAPDEEDDSDED